MKITITNLQDAYPVGKRRIREVIEELLLEEKVDAELSIVLVDKEEITRLNKQFLGRQEPTDVLSFPLDASDRRISGEVVVCVPVAVEYTKEAGTEVEGEIMLYIVHGVLHLLGYDDATRRLAQCMHRREREILSRFGYEVAEL